MATTTADIDLGLENCTTAIGSWVRNFNIDDPDNASKAPALQRALAERGVLFFDLGRVPGGEEYKAFAGLFGKVQDGFAQKVKDQPKDFVPLIDNDIMPMQKYLTNVWHSDGGPFDVPPLAAILSPEELVGSGGDTMWSSMYAAYEALSPTFKTMLDGLQVLNNNKRPSFLEPKEHIHPAVVVNPITGRKCLHYNPIYTDHFIGLTEKENDALVRFLVDHINTPEFHVRLTWKLGYVAVWHQQATQHRAVDDRVGSRKLKRLTVDGAPLIPATS